MQNYFKMKYNKEKPDKSTLPPTLTLHYCVSSEVYKDDFLLKPNKSVSQKKTLDSDKKPRNDYQHVYKSDYNMAEDNAFLILYDMREIELLAELIKQQGLLGIAKNPVPVEKLVSTL